MKNKCFCCTEKKNFMTSPKLVSNICCMFFNMFTLTEVNLYELDQHSQFVQALFMYVLSILYSIKH